eukprot:1752415-Rhodomonas_salina.1
MNWEREASALVGNAKKIAEATTRLQAEPNLDAAEGQAAQCSAFFWKLARPYVLPKDRDAATRAHPMGRMTVYFHGLDISHPSLLLISEWSWFAKAGQSTALANQLRLHIRTIKRGWVPAPIFSGVA